MPMWIPQQQVGMGYDVVKNKHVLDAVGVRVRVTREAESWEVSSYGWICCCCSMYGCAYEQDCSETSSGGRTALRGVMVKE